MKCDRCESEATIAVMNGEVAYRHLCGLCGEAASMQDPSRLPSPKEVCDSCQKKAKPLVAILQPIKKGQVVYRAFCVDCILPELEKYPNGLKAFIAHLEGRELK